MIEVMSSLGVNHSLGRGERRAGVSRPLLEKEGEGETGGVGHAHGVRVDNTLFQLCSGMTPV